MNLEPAPTREVVDAPAQVRREFWWKDRFCALGQNEFGVLKGATRRAKLMRARRQPHHKCFGIKLHA
ncbi:hypothetical protein D3C86_2076240 [compost metagenome]